MIIIFLRTLIIFTVLIVIMRLMGKRQIGEMQPFEFIVTLIIADLACIPMADVSIPLIYGISAILTLFILHQLLSIIERSGNLAKKILSGKPSVVINKDGVDLKELRSNNMGVDDLIESMRSAGYFSFEEAEYAIYESNGKLSVLESECEKPDSVPVILINDKKLVKQNLPLLKLEKEKLDSFLKEQNLTVKQTEVMTVTSNGKVYLKGKGKRFQLLQLPPKENGL